MRKSAGVDGFGKSQPSAETALRVAKAFGITVEDLYAEPRDCLAAALPHLHDAPVTDLEPGTYDVVTGQKVADVAPAKVTLHQARAQRAIAVSSLRPSPFHYAPRSILRGMHRGGLEEVLARIR